MTRLPEMRTESLMKISPVVAVASPDTSVVSPEPKIVSDGACRLLPMVTWPPTPLV